jgi:hypothetical protein
MFCHVTKVDQNIFIFIKKLVFTSTAIVTLEILDEETLFVFTVPVGLLLTIFPINTFSWLRKRTSLCNQSEVPEAASVAAIHAR